MVGKSKNINRLIKDYKIWLFRIDNNLQVFILYYYRILERDRFGGKR